MYIYMYVYIYINNLFIYIYRTFDFWRISRETLSGKSSESTTPLRKESQRGSSSSIYVCIYVYIYVAPWISGGFRARR